VFLFEGTDADDAAASAVVLELHPSGDLREDRVILAESGVEPRPEPPSTLANDDRAALHHVPVVRLDAEPLRVRVAAVAGAALSFFMSHNRDPEIGELVS
jgi:hypothetical protein